MLVRIDKQRRTQDLSHVLIAKLFQNRMGTTDKHLPFQMRESDFNILLHGLVDALCGWKIDFDHPTTQHASPSGLLWRSSS